MKSRTGKFTDPRDGKVYKTVKIGKQVWFAENLNFDCKGSKCYNDDPKNAEKYGRLYDWETAKKACPRGWHLPSNEEWNELVDFAGGLGENELAKAAGKKLKAKSGWEDDEGKSGNGIDKYGFSALPGGGFIHSFDNVGLQGYWWSAFEYYTKSAYLRIMFQSNIFTWYVHDRSCLFSVRCIRDKVLPQGICREQEKMKTAKEKEFFVLEEMLDDASVLKHIPKELKTYEFYLAAVKEGQDICGGPELVIEFVPKEFKTPELCLAAVKRFTPALRYIPKSLKTPQFYLEAVRANGFALEIVPEKFKTFELCLAAVLYDGTTLEYVPEKFKTLELCIVAMRSNYLFEEVPEKLRARVKAAIEATKFGSQRT